MKAAERRVERAGGHRSIQRIDVVLDVVAPQRAAVLAETLAQALGQWADAAAD